MAVEINEYLDTFENVRIDIKDPEKSKVTYSVCKSNDGFSFYEIRISKGNVPKELTSRYTKLDQAEQAVTKYLAKQPKSSAQKREEIAAEIEARKLNAAESKSATHSPVQ